MAIAFSSAASATEPERATDWQLINSNWPRLVQTLKNFAHDSERKHSTDHLYYFELWTYDLMRAAIAEEQRAIRDQLLSLYVSVFDDLVTVSSYKYYYDPRSDEQRLSEHPLPSATRLWLNQDGIEDVLDSSQFIFLLAATTRHLLQSDDQSQETQNFVKSAAPLVRDHLLRWILRDKVFQVRGWQCGHGLYDHRSFLELKRRRSFASPEHLSYCNMVSDTDLWIIGATAETIAVQAALEPDQRFSTADNSALRNYLRVATELLADRTTSKTFPRSSGAPVDGLVFDAGANDDHDDSLYAAFSEEQCPPNERRAAHGVGWDVSHGTRQPVVFSALLDTKDRTGVGWPDEAVLAGFGRAFAFGVFEGNLKKPRLRNYMDGSNGWYRVDEKHCSGYRPFGMSYALIFGAWGRYTPYATEVGKIVEAAREILTSKDSADTTFRLTVWDRPRYINGRPQNEGMANPSVSVWSLPLLSTYAIDSDTNKRAGP